MKIVKQSDFNVAEEAEEFRSGRKYFERHSRRRVCSYIPAWTCEGSFFQLTLHAEPLQESAVLAFASGRIRERGTAVAIIEVIGVLPQARGQALAVRMQEFIMKALGLPLVSAHAQTPEGRDLWLRMLTHAKGMTLHVVHNGASHRIETPEDVAKLPFDPYDGSDAFFMLEKNARDRGNTVKVVARRVHQVAAA